MTTKPSRATAKTTTKASATKGAASSRKSATPQKGAAAKAKQAAAQATKAAPTKPAKSGEAKPKSSKKERKKNPPPDLSSLHLPWSWPLVDDVSIASAILFNAPLDAPEVSTLGSDATWLAHIGAAAFRRGDYARAIDAWTRMAHNPEPSTLTDGSKAWRALALVRGLETTDETRRREILEEALALAPALSHLAGEILCALGKTAEGLAVLEAARNDAEMLEWRLLRHAIWLTRAGKAKKAGKLIDGRLEKIAQFEAELRVEAIHAWVTAGQPEKAIPHFETLQSALPGLARYLEKGLGAGPLPESLETLAKDPRLAQLGVWFLDRDDAEAAHASLSLGPSPAMGVLPGPAMWDALGDGAPYVVVAEALTRPSRTAYLGASRARLLVHPDKPGRIWLCLDPKIPAFLWPEASADVEGITSLLAPYRCTLAKEEPCLSDLTRSIRLYLGHDGAVPSPYSGQLEELGFHTWARVVVMSPFLESYGWGSEHFDDPHQGFVDRGGLDGMLALRRTAGMDEQRVPSEAYRTMHSRSIMVLEQHRSGFIIEMKYRPGTDAEKETVSNINARFKTTFPEDLPLDCVGTLMHFEGALTAEQLMESITPDLAQDEWWRPHAVGALLHQTLRLDEWLSTLPPILAPEADAIAWRNGRLGFLLRRAIATPELRAPIQRGPFLSNIASSNAEDGEDEDEDEDEEES